MIGCKLKNFDDRLQSSNTAVVIRDRLEREGFHDSEPKMAILEVWLQLVEADAEWVGNWTL